MTDVNQMAMDNTEPQDSLPSQDATHFTIEIDRSFMHELRRRTSELQPDRSLLQKSRRGGRRAEAALETTLETALQSKPVEAAIEGISRVDEAVERNRFGRWYLRVADALSLQWLEELSEENKRQKDILHGRSEPNHQPQPRSIFLEYFFGIDGSQRDLGNVFMARLMTGYAENTVTVSDHGISVLNKATTKTVRWGDIAWWSRDDLSLMIATNVQLTIAIPLDQLPSPIEQRIIENLSVLGLAPRELRRE